MIKINMITYEKGMILQSGCYYLGNKPRYDFYPEDAAICDSNLLEMTTPYVYNGLRAAFWLDGLEDVTLDFNGAEIVLHDRIAPFVMTGCKNITVKNCAIRYERAFYSQMDVTETGDGYLKLRLNPKFPCRVENGYLYAKGSDWKNCLNRDTLLMTLFDAETKAPAGAEIILSLIGEEIFPDPNPPMPIRHLRVDSDTDQRYIYLRGDIPASWKFGTILAFSHEPRDKHGIAAVECCKITVDNVRLMNGAGMGFFGARTNDIILKRFNMFTDELSEGVVSNNADGVHCIACGGSVLMEDCIMEGMLDDGFNFHSQFCIVDSRNETGITVSGRGAAFPESALLFASGDRIAFYRGTTYELIEEAVIVNALPAGYRKIFWTVDKPCGDVKPEDIVENLTRQPDITIKNCRFGKFRGTSRLQSRGRISVEGCKFYNNTEPALLLSGDATYWFESGPVQDLTVSNCGFFASGGARINVDPDFSFTGQAQYYHKNITVCGNRFNCPHVLNAVHADNITASGNVYTHGSQGEDITGETGLYVTLANCGARDIREAVEL